MWEGRSCETPPIPICFSHSLDPTLPLVSYRARLQNDATGGAAAVNEELQRIYESVASDDHRSRLDPFGELILRWRRQGKSHDRIRQLLADKCGVKIAFGPLYRYIERRSKPRKQKPEIEIESEQPTTSSAAKPINQTVPPRPPQTQPGEDPWAEQRERMRRHKAEPPPPPKRKPFEVSEEDLDGTKPLRMMPLSTSKEN